MLPEMRARLVDLAKALVEEEGEGAAPSRGRERGGRSGGVTLLPLLTRELLIERCEGEFLEEAGFIPSSVGWKKKEVRVNTRLFYTQQKFNLLREESEGYAKLITALAAFGDSGADGNTPSSNTVAAAVRAVQSLIGYFDLDPNRALDLILEAYEQKPTNVGFLQLLGLFRKENFAQVLGFKFQNHAKGFARKEEEVVEAGTVVNPEAETTPESLYVLAATLVRSGAVELDALYPHLAPTDAAAVEAHKADVAIRLAGCKKIGVVNLLAKAVEADKEKAKEVDPLTVACTPAADPHNQKLGLLRGCLTVGYADGAAAIIDRLSNLGLDPAEDGEVRAALCAALRNAIAEPYAHAAPAGCATLNLKP
jgi:THO complex subunit 2